MKNSRQNERYDDLDKAELVKLLLKAEKDLLLKDQEAERLKTSFLSNISHEVRTPMNAIMGFSDLLKDEDITKTERDFFLNSITSSSAQLLSIIDNIIEAAQIESDQITKNDEPCSINEFLEGIYNSYIDSQKYKNKEHIKLKLRLQQDDDPCILTDPRILSRIFTNLIDNAYKFTKSGSIEFGYNLLNGSCIQFFIIDTGIGIPKDKFNIIFDRFRQADDGFSKKHDGLGMGLTIAKKLAEIIDGKLDIVSSPGLGSKLYLSLPLKAVNLPINQIKVPLNKNNSWFNNLLGNTKIQTVPADPFHKRLLADRRSYSA